MKTVGRRAWGWAFLALGAGCGGAAADRRGVAPPAAWSPREPAPSATSARWAYLPARPARLSGRVPLGQGNALLFGARGERWLWQEGSPRAEAAGELADQDLVAASRSASGAWLFVGHKGSLYEAASPLGPFLRARTPPEPVVRADAQGRTLLAVTARGTLLRSEDAGASFRTASPGPGAVADVALLDAQIGLALTHPERLLATADGGATWAPVDAPAVGAFRLLHETSGGVGIVGVERALLWRPGHPVDRLAAAPTPATLALEAELAPAPDASELREGRGAIVAGEALALRAPEPGAGPWSLGRAPVGERLRFSPLPGTESCAHLALSAAPGSLLLACSLAPTAGGLSSVSFWRAPGPEGPWASSPTVLEGQPGEVRLVAGGAGQMLVTGACRRQSKRPCDPDEPLWLPSWDQLASAPRPAPKPAASTASAPSAEGRAAPPPESASPFRAVVAPSLRGRPLAMAFGPGAAKAYLVGRHDKGDELTLFVSDDGGRSFHARDWGLSKREGAEPLAQPADSGEEVKAYLSVSDDETVAVVLEGPARAWLATADGDGRMITLQAPPGPEDVTRVGAYGRFALAVDGDAAYETLDGGLHWATLGPVATLACAKRDDCTRPVVCGPAGCVVGGDVGRVGWGASPRPGREAPSEAAPASMLPPPAPLTCRLDRERWLPLPRGASLPGAAQADRGKVAWAVLAEDPVRGSATMVHAPAASAGRLEEVTLLAPSPQAGQMLVAAQSQIEGGVALRLNLPPPSAGNAERVGELAWENLFEGKTYRVTVRDQALLRPIRLRGRGAGVASRADPDLLSVSAGGVFIVPQEVERKLFFVDARGRVERTFLPALPSKTLDGDELEASLEAVRLDGRSAALGIVDPWALLRSTAPTKTWDALSLGRPEPSPSGTSALVRLVYQGASPRLALFVYPPSPQPSTAQAFALHAEGPPLGEAASAPTQGALVHNYRPCTPADRAQSTRIVAPAEIGTRRGVLVESPDGSPLGALASSAMVLYGSATSPCAAALEAAPMPAAGPGRAPEGPREGALVFLSDLEHGWFFRTGVSDERPLEARPMRCRFNPGAALPPALEHALRTAAPDARKPRQPPEVDEE